MSDDLIAEEARRRESSHHAVGHWKKYPKMTPIPSWEGGGNRIGLRGEQAFAERYGLTVDFERRLAGDEGVDFKLTIDGVPYTVDCKGAHKPKELICEVRLCKPLTIYVLCRYWPSDDCCSLLGWQWGTVLMRSEPKAHGHGVLNYWQPASMIRKMRELDAKVGRV